MTAVKIILLSLYVARIGQACIAGLAFRDAAICFAMAASLVIVNRIGTWASAKIN